jgi:transposase
VEHEGKRKRSTPITLGADKAYDAEDFVNELRSMNATAHVAQNRNGRASAIDGRTTRHPSIPPEKLLRAMLLQAFYSIRSERQLMERLEFDLLFRWFVGIGVDDAVWDHSTFSKNRDRLEIPPLSRGHRQTAHRGTGPRRQRAGHASHSGTIPPKAAS